MKTSGFRIELLFVMILISSCSKDVTGPVDDKIDQIEISKDLSVITYGIDRVVQFNAKAKNSTGETLSNKFFTWSIDNNEIGSINQEGILTIMGFGNLVVTAESEGVNNSLPIIISKKPEGGDVAFANVNVITMESESILFNQTVVIEAGKIAIVGSGNTVEIPDGMSIIDGNGKYLVPGLADMHVHTFFKTDLIPYVATGVTTILDMGNGYNLKDSKTWKNEVIKGVLTGPNILVSANARGSSDNGHPNTITDTEIQGRQFVRSNKDFDFIKVYNGISSDTFSAIVEEADKFEITVIGHGVRQPGMSGILNGGLKMVAHGYEYYATIFSGSTSPPQSDIDNAISLTKNANAYVTGNLSLDEAFAIMWGNQEGFNELMQRPGVEYVNSFYLNGGTLNGGPVSSWSQLASNFTSRTSGSWRNVLDFEMFYLKQFHDAGIPLLLGTDSPVQPGMSPGFSIHEDIRLYVEMGLSNFEILTIGTVNAGKFVNDYVINSEAFGMIKEGYRGDVLMVDDNPLENLETLIRPEVVVVRGKVYTKNDLDSELRKLKR